MADHSAQANAAGSWPRRAVTTASLIGAASVLLSGTSYARLSTTGSGTAPGAVGTISLTTQTTAGAGLYPGGSAAVTVTVTNTSAAAKLVVTAIVGSGSVTVTGGKGTCSPTVVSFTAGALPGTALAHGASATYPGTVAMTAAAQDGCQSGSFTLPLTVSGQAG